MKKRPGALSPAVNGAVKLVIEPGLLAERNPVFVGHCVLCGWPCPRTLTVCRAHADLVGR